MKTTCLLAVAAFLALGGCAGQSSDDITSGDNPFLAPYGTAFDVPPFDRIQPEHFEPAFEEGMKQERAEIAAIGENPDAPTFENTIAALDRSGHLLGEVDAVFHNLISANTNDQLRQINQRMSPRLAAHADALHLDKRLFARIRTIYDARETLDLDPEQLFLLEHRYKDGVRNGVFRRSRSGSVSPW